MPPMGVPSAIVVIKHLNVLYMDVANCFTPTRPFHCPCGLINLASTLAAISELLFEGSLGNEQWLERGLPEAPRIV